MNNPQRILISLDSYLNSPVRLILYGKAALVLGFESAPLQYGSTMDVDAILPEVEMDEIEKNDDFWDALEKTNEDLATSGLYITHLFSDAQVILSPRWLEDIISIKSPFSHISLFRPCSADLILTKMMRVDPIDRADIEFLLKQDDLDFSELEQKLKSAVIPNIQELKEAFKSNLLWLNLTIENFQQR